MAFIQYITCTRPDTSVPFFEQTGDGKVRLERVWESIIENYPDLITRDMPIGMNDDLNILTFTSTYTYSDFGAWQTIREMMTFSDPTFKEDRFNYYAAAGHTIKMEYQDETMENRDLLAFVSPDIMIFKNMDGTIRERLPNEVVTLRLPTGETRTYNLNDTVTVVYPDGQVTTIPKNSDPSFSEIPFVLPDGIKPPAKYI